MRVFLLFTAFLGICFAYSIVTTLYPKIVVLPPDLYNDEDYYNAFQLKRLFGPNYYWMINSSLDQTPGNSYINGLISYNNSKLITKKYFDMAFLTTNTTTNLPQVPQICYTNTSYECIGYKHLGLDIVAFSANYTKDMYYQAKTYKVVSTDWELSVS